MWQANYLITQFYNHHQHHFGLCTLKGDLCHLYVCLRVCAVCCVCVCMCGVWICNSFLPEHPDTIPAPPPPPSTVYFKSMPTYSTLAEWSINQAILSLLYDFILYIYNFAHTFARMASTKYRYIAFAYVLSNMNIIRPKRDTKRISIPYS